MVAATRISGRGRAGRPGHPGTHGIRVPLVRMCQSGSEMWWLAQSEIAIYLIAISLSLSAAFLLLLLLSCELQIQEDPKRARSEFT